MCFSSKAPKFRKVKRSYDIILPDEWENGPYDDLGEYTDVDMAVSGFDHPQMPLILNDNPRYLKLGEWGIIPFWAKDDSIQNKTLNAKIETVEELASFKNSVNNRCLILTEEFYDWKHEQPGKSKTLKDKYAIKVAGQEVFAMAGIYNLWNDRLTYTVLTTQANALMSDIHNTKMRMPIVLRKEDELAWLEQMPVKEFAFPYEADLEATRLTYNIPDGLF